jgi:two-component system, response regulator / RNA-binding antiterminator
MSRASPDLNPDLDADLDNGSNAGSAPRAGAPLRVLLIDDGARHVGLIHEELTRQGHLVVGVVDSALLIHDCVLRLQPDVVIVDSESPTRDTLEHLGAVSASSPRPVVVFSEDADAEPMQQALKAGVSAYVIDGLHPQRLLPVLQVAIARFEQDRALKGQLETAQAQLSERKGVERAKGILMKEFGLTEEQAFAHLRKLAMDRGQKLAAVAERVIDAQGLLRPPV